MSKGGQTIEQLNIVGKRSGQGFVAHRPTLATAMSRAIARRVTLCGVAVGIRGLVAYLRALTTSNVVKVIPDGKGDGKKPSLKVSCGNHLASIANGQWITEPKANKEGELKGGIPQTFCEVVISPHNTVVPNVGVIELSEAIAFVLPFTTKDEDKPLYRQVHFKAVEGKLVIEASDSFRVARTAIDYEGEGEALIPRDELIGLPQALRRARRARIAFVDSSGKNKVHNLVIDTELITYKLNGYGGSYPDIDKVLPTEVKILACFDSLEAMKAVSSLRQASSAEIDAIDLAIGQGTIKMASPDTLANAELQATTLGEGKVRIDGSYLAEAMKAHRGLIDLKVLNSYSPVTFSLNGSFVAVMPMRTAEAEAQYKADSEAKAKEAPAKAKAEAKAEAKTEPVKVKK